MKSTRRRAVQQDDAVSIVFGLTGGNDSSPEWNWCGFARESWSIFQSKRLKCECETLCCASEIKIWHISFPLNCTYISEAAKYCLVGCSQAFSFLHWQCALCLTQKLLQSNTSLAIIVALL